MILAFNKPYGVVSQFSDDGSQNRTLSDFNFPKNVYPIGRLDADSEGLLLLSDEAKWNNLLLSPKNGHNRTYLSQVERIPSQESLKKLSEGLSISDYTTLACCVSIPDPQPDIKPRVPPIRYRKNVPDCWIQLVLREGKNRQVRRMTAAVGHPTLRLIRTRIGSLELGDIESGNWKILSEKQIELLFKS